MSYLKKLRDECLTIKWLTLIIILYVIGIIMRQDIMLHAKYEQKAINQWDILFNFWSNPMMIIYFFIPFWVFFCIREILAESQNSVLIRVKTWLGWMRHIVYKLHFLLVAALIVWLIVSLLLTIGIPYEAFWSSWALNESYSNYLVSSLTHSNMSPVELFLLQIGLIIFFMGCLCVFLGTAYIITFRFSVLIALGLALYLGSIISFKMFPPEWTLFKVTNYAILAFSYNAFQTVWSGYGFFILIILLCWTAVVLKFSKQQ